MRNYLSVLLLLLTVAFGGTALAQPQPAAPAPVPPLRKLILAGSEEVALAQPEERSDILVLGLPLLAKQELAEAVAPFIGKPLTLELVNAIGNAIKQYGIKNDRILNMVVPNQDATTGILRMVVILGTYRDITFRGNRWFSAKMLAEKLGLKEGDEISIARLDEAVNWANNNPFRRVQVMLNPIEKMPGKTDLIVGVEEQLPLKLIASFDDSGADVIGKNHYTAMLQYGNMLGLDHQLTYQFVTTDHSKVYKAHALDYRIPLKWRHYLQINASTSRAKPSFAGGLFNQDAKNNGAGLRYTVPLKGEKTVEWYAALDFKQSNNNLEYGGLQIINNETDLYHVGSGVSAVIRDKWGGWMVGANAMLSPGGLSPRNKTDVLRTARVDASQTYLYGNVSLQRFTTIAKGWDMVTRLHGQISTDNLLGSEQLTAGGTGSVRGYDERVLAGDQGFVFNNELMLPSWKKQLQFFKSKKRPLLDTRVLAFYDVAHLSYKHRHPTDLPFSPMASAGLGLRVGVPGSFGLSFDYGWQITRIPRPQSGTSGGHLKATLAF